MTTRPTRAASRNNPNRQAFPLKFKGKAIRNRITTKSQSNRNVPPSYLDERRRRRYRSGDLAGLATGDVPVIGRDNRRSTVESLLDESMFTYDNSQILRWVALLFTKSLLADLAGSSRIFGVCQGTNETNRMGFCYLLRKMCRHAKNGLYTVESACRDGRHRSCRFSRFPAWQAWLASFR